MSPGSLVTAALLDDVAQVEAAPPPDVLDRVPGPGAVIAQERDAARNGWNRARHQEFAGRGRSPGLANQPAKSADSIAASTSGSTVRIGLGTR
jgi:hypothetical protein